VVKLEVQSKYLESTNRSHGMIALLLAVDEHTNDQVLSNHIPMSINNLVTQLETKKESCIILSYDIWTF